MQFIKSLIFNIFLYFGLIFIFVLAIPTLILPSKVTIFFGRLSAKYIILILKLVMNTKVIFHGEENLKKVDQFFVASAHQSMFETFALQIPLDGPIFILKKELLKIPLFGWYLKKMGCISVDRNKISKDNLNFSHDVSKVIKNTNKTLIIFPQGTRKSFDDRSKFKKGFVRIYNELKIACLPIAVNSGKVWPKNGRLISNQLIKVSILSIILPGIEQNKFATEVEQVIYKELDMIS